jgi:hypothetical protein
LRSAAREVAGSAGALSEREFARLLAELVDLPCLDLSLQVELPKLLSPALGRLCEAIAEDDELAGEVVIEEVLDELDTAVERARLARAVIALRDGGRCGRSLAAVAVIDLASGSRQLLCASVIQSVAVRAGGGAHAGRGTVGGVASGRQAQLRFAAGEAGEQRVEIGAREAPLERLGDLPVVDLERRDAGGECIEVGEVVGG